MKFFILQLVILCSFSMARAQSVNVNADTNASDAEETTIHIKKGKSAQTLAPETKPQYEITEGQDDVVGDGAILSKEAKNKWKEACVDWKRELKENNKGNQVLVSNCG